MSNNLLNLQISITYLGTVEARQRLRGRCSWTQIMVPLHREGLGSIFTDFSVQVARFSFFPLAQPAKAKGLLEMWMGCSYVQVASFLV